MNSRRDVYAVVPIKDTNHGFSGRDEQIRRSERFKQRGALWL